MEEQKFDDLEPHQYEDIYEVHDQPFRDISGRVAQKLIYFGLAMAVVLIALSFVIKLPREINMPFVLKGGQRELIIQFPHKTYVRKKLVSTRDKIEKGDPIFAVTSPEIINYIQEIHDLQDALDMLQGSKKDALDRKQELIREKIKGLENHIQITQEEITATRSAQTKASESLEIKVSLLDKQYKRDLELSKQNAISPSDLEKSESAMQQARSDLIFTAENYNVQVLLLQNNLQNYKNEIQNERARLEKNQIEYDLELEHAIHHVDHAKKNMEMIYGPTVVDGETLVLLAQKDGEISLVHETESTLEPQEILAKIKTRSAGYYVYAEAGPEQVGQLKKGQVAVLKFESFPHYYYGVMKAELEDKSSSPDEAGHFPIRANIFDEGELGDRISKGLTGRASVILEEKTVFDHIFRYVAEKTSFD